MKVIRHKDVVYAYVIGAEYHNDGIDFVTPPDFSQQLAYMNHPEGHFIKPHVHNFIERSVYYTQEVLLIRNGKIRVDFYDHDQNYFASDVLKTGDVILLATGGHGFFCLEPTEMIEIKQGPYAGDKDKTRFDAIPEAKVRMYNA